MEKGSKGREDILYWEIERMSSSVQGKCGRGGMLLKGVVLLSHRLPL